MSEQRNLAEFQLVKHNLFLFFTLFRLPNYSTLFIPHALIYLIPCRQRIYSATYHLNIFARLITSLVLLSGPQHLPETCRAIVDTEMPPR